MSRPYQALDEATKARIQSMHDEGVYMRDICARLHISRLRIYREMPHLKQEPSRAFSYQAKTKGDTGYITGAASKKDAEFSALVKNQELNIKSGTLVRVCSGPVGQSQSSALAW